MPVNPKMEESKKAAGKGETSKAQTEQEPLIRKEEVHKSRHDSRFTDLGPHVKGKNVFKNKMGLQSKTVRRIIELNPTNAGSLWLHHP